MGILCCGPVSLGALMFVGFIGTWMTYCIDGDQRDHGVRTGRNIPEMASRAEDGSLLCCMLGWIGCETRQAHCHQAYSEGLAISPAPSSFADNAAGAPRESPAGHRHKDDDPIYRPRLNSPACTKVSDRHLHSPRFPAFAGSYKNAAPPGSYLGDDGSACRYATETDTCCRQYCQANIKRINKTTLSYYQCNDISYHCSCFLALGKRENRRLRNATRSLSATLASESAQPAKQQGSRCLTSPADRMRRME